MMIMCWCMKIIDLEGPPGTPRLRHPEDSHHVSCSARAGNPPARFHFLIIPTFWILSFAIQQLCLVTFVLCLYILAQFLYSLTLYLDLWYLCLQYSGSVWPSTWTGRSWRRSWWKRRGRSVCKETYLSLVNLHLWGHVFLTIISTTNSLAFSLHQDSR